VCSGIVSLLGHGSAWLRHAMIAVSVGRFMRAVAGRADTSNHCCIAGIVMIVLASLLIDSGIRAVESVRLVWASGGVIFLLARVGLHSRI
jgi:hypothetical protein